MQKEFPFKEQSCETALLKTKLHDYRKHTSYFPRIIQARQMSILAILCSMEYMLSELKKTWYFTLCNKVFVLNHFLQMLKPSRHFLEEFVMAHAHFHVVLTCSTPKISAQAMESALLNLNTYVLICFCKLHDS